MMPALICALCGHLSHITLSAAMSRTIRREEAMGDLRRILDVKGAVRHLVDTVSISKEWVRGPLTEVCRWGVLVGLVCHACDVCILCLGHGCYATDQPGLFCSRYVIFVLALAFIWRVLTLPRAAVSGHELYGVVALAHTVYAVG